MLSVEKKEIIVTTKAKSLGERSRFYRKKILDRPFVQHLEDICFQREKL